MRNTIADSILAGVGTVGVGHSLTGGEFTGDPNTDIPLKIILPIVSGLIFPFLKNMLEDFREDLRERRRLRWERKEQRELEKSETE